MIIVGLCQDRPVLTLPEFCTTSSEALSVETYLGIIKIVRIFLNGSRDFCWEPRQPAMLGNLIPLTPPSLRWGEGKVRGFFSFGVGILLPRVQHDHFNAGCFSLGDFNEFLRVLDQYGEGLEVHGNDFFGGEHFRRPGSLEGVHREDAADG